MRKIYYSFPILIFMFIMIACDTKKNVQAETTEKEFVFDSTKIQLNIPTVDSISVIFTDDESKAVINAENWAKLAEDFSTAAYDLEWNDKDIMLKMVAPDYTLIIQRKGESAENNEWLMIWKENGKVKYSGKWYVLAEDKQSSLYQLLESYRNSEK